MTSHILVADDDPDIVLALRYLLETEGYRVSAANSPHEVALALGKSSFNLLLMDLNYARDTTSGSEGLALIASVRKLDDQMPIVVMTAWGNVELAVEAMRAGARDFIQKPWDNERLLSVIRSQILLEQSERKSRTLEERNKILSEQLTSKDSLIVGKSRAMSELMSQLSQVARSDATVLLTGENGTGKSLLAHRVHLLSGREHQDYVSVNMGSISESLFESEMFGHVKGAFTDARENRIGRFELAGQGTLFLDEIGNIPLSQQVKLLRVLEERRFERVGSSRTQESQCRLIAATNSNLDQAVAAGRFRQDLLYRINTITLRVPSLRERTEDILPLAKHFLNKFGSKYNKPDVAFTSDAMEQLTRYSWPGNIRELSNTIERSVILCAEGRIDSAGLNCQSASPSIGSHLHGNDDDATFEQIERNAITRRMQRFDGNGVEAARSLGLSKSALYRRLEKFRWK
ncbi:MAG: sigma-54 dependent transcriptional regulator [Gammaproteobacteria bacterium]|nr:sigma-54 dependent transcriptional regulator [Gammaproteobacteria bacterium]MDP2140576.1 sigma-54 dependent transcriptional regulator [Gammaproteobacteria bacterium]MDP2347345.1 sigma-54 dependent transcriptional regulator [Gammaproteobacteria bacterium]